MCKALEEIKKMSEDKGLEQDIKQGETAILLSMLNKGMTCEEVSSLTDIPLDKVKKAANFTVRGEV